MAKVIYVSFIRLTDKVARDWYIDFLIERHCSVEFWDVVRLVREDHEEVGSLNPPYLRRLSSFDEFEALLDDASNWDAVYVMLISYSGRLSRIFRSLSRRGRRMVFISWGAMPTSPIPLRDRLRAVHYNPLRLATKIVDRATGRGARYLKLVKPFDIVFAAGRVLLNANQFAKRVVPINLCDYAHFANATKQNDRIIEGQYAVFLDINLPFQSDLKMAGLAAIEPKGYYRSINRFFCMFERRFAMKIVVAAHPKTRLHPGLFESRPAYRSVTAELVRDATIVISHTSTAIGYAVLNHKPLIFIYTDAMREVYASSVMRELRTYSSYLNAPLLNVDRVVSIDEITIGDVKADQYDRYKYDFLTSPETEHESTADILLRELDAEFGII